MKTQKHGGLLSACQINDML